MALTVDSLPVDPRVITFWKESIKTADLAPLQDFAKNHKHLNAGFRLGKVNPTILVTRVVAMLDQMKELSPDLCALLRDATLSRPLIFVLSEELIQLALPQLADAYGRLDFFAGLLLDERESIRRIGHVGVQSWDGIPAEDSEQKKAVQDLQKLLPRFLTLIQPLLHGGGSFENSISAALAKQPHKRDEKTEKLIKNLRAKRTEFNRLQRKFSEGTRDLENLKVVSEAHRRALESATKNLEAMTQQYGDLNSKFESHVQNAIARELDNKLVPWLKQAQHLELAVSKSSGGLQEEVRALLSRQAAIDKRFGLRSQLAQESAACQALALQIKEAMAESIEPLPELHTVAKKLASRISEIEKTLKASAALTTEQAIAPALFVERVSAASTLDELASVRKGWMYLEEIGLLGDRGLSAGYALLRAKASQLYLKARLSNEMRPNQSLLAGVPLYGLQRQLADGKSCVLIVDGHNVLHKLNDLFGDSFEHGIPGAKAQKALIAKVATICDVHPNLNVKLWFDSPVAHDETIQGNFMVHYSGGTGANRADEQIVAYLNFLNTQSPQPFKALVTEDRDEAAKAQGCGALILSPLEFEVLLEEE